MESRPSKIGQDRDRISALPDDLLLVILERLRLHDAVRAGAVSTRWQHLTHKLSRMVIDVRNFHGTNTLEIMDKFTAAVCRFLSLCPPAECMCDCKSKRAVKTLGLCFNPSAPHHLSSIGHAVQDTVRRGKTDLFELKLIPHSDLIALGQADRPYEFGQQFMSFSRAFPTAIRWLTGLSLKRLEFYAWDLPRLIGACDKLKRQSLQSCGLSAHSVLKIDLPNSVITELEFVRFRCKQIELVSLPKLTQLSCRCWCSMNYPPRFGYVPELRTLTLDCHAKKGQSPFALSDCFSMNATNLSALYLDFNCQMIWIHPEHPKQLAAIFRNLTDVALCCVFPECDMNWTLFIHEAAPALQVFTLDRARHSCVRMSEDSAKKINVVWEPSKDFKHLNLKLLVMIGFEEEDKVENYIRLVMERATRLKRIKLQSHTCKERNAINIESLRRSQVDEASRRRIKERLTSGASSTVEITIC